MQELIQIKNWEQKLCHLKKLKNAGFVSPLHQAFFLSRGISNIYLSWKLKTIHCSSPAETCIQPAGATNMYELRVDIVYSILHPSLCSDVIAWIITPTQKSHVCDKYVQLLHYAPTSLHRVKWIISGTSIHNTCVLTMLMPEQYLLWYYTVQAGSC